jgi:protoporphyrinogen oxidase
MAKIGIIGGGFTGISAAYYLRNLKDHEVTVFEYHDRLGGLASGFKMKEWNWPIDRVIHHWFSTDQRAFDIAKEIGLKDKIILNDTKSSCYFKGKIAQLDSPKTALTFPFLSRTDRLRLSYGMAKIKLSKNYKKFEKETAFSFVKRMTGNKAFERIWEPLLLGKFGDNAKDVNGAWIWGRIHSRTKKLAYIEGGFQTFIDKVGEEIESKNGKIILNSTVKKIERKREKLEVSTNQNKYEFDYLLLAVSMPVGLQIFNFPDEYKEKHKHHKYIGAQYFVLELNNSFLNDGTYWLNINESDFPFMMIAEHTNFVDKKNYNNKHMIWVGKYLDYDNPLWQLSEEEYLDKIFPYLKKINSRFDKSWIYRSFFTRFKNAQPVIPINYSKTIPELKTPVKNVYIASMNHIYPWDRGTNNALNLGHNAAQLIKEDMKNDLLYSGKN